MVEDNQAAQVIMQEAFKEAKSQHQLHITTDGIEALKFLKKESQNHEAIRPDLIILDLNMPKKNGLELLTDIKNEPKWRHIPILVFSNSEFSADICKCYALGINAYLSKPIDFEGFIDFARIVDLFWFKLVRYCPH